MRKLTTQQFIEKAISIHGDKYDYSLVDYKNARTKVKIICPIHGVFEQTPNDHLSRCGCNKCAIIKNSDKIRSTTQQFIEKAISIHGDKYDYSLVDYKNNKTKVKIICPEHGIFEQTPNSHLLGKGCNKCGIVKGHDKQRSTTEEFIKKAISVHGDTYDYSLVDYKHTHTKVKIICPEHGVFEQEPNAHLSGQGCRKCAVDDKYGLYTDRLLGVKCRRNKDDNNVLEVKCMYCDRWYIPTLVSVQCKIQAINAVNQGESNLYCSDECKKACPTYGQITYPKDFKLDTSREVQPALRKIVLKRDNYTCQKCDATDKELHCHHYEGIEVNPVESADIDMCITLCIDCHHDTHKKDKCGIKDYRRETCYSS